MKYQNDAGKKQKKKIQTLGLYFYFNKAEMCRQKNI